MSGDSIIASYATGAVKPQGGIPEESRGIVANGFGSLLGNNGGTISASYGTGNIPIWSDDEGNYIGGLVGYDAGSISDSYWDTNTVGWSDSAGGVGKTTSELQSPTDYEGIYANWNVDTDGTSGGDDPWDFGTSSQYPALSVDFNGDGRATWEEFGHQRSSSEQSQTQAVHPHVFVMVDKHNPLLGDRVTLTVHDSDPEDGDITYQWQRLRGGDWRNVGPDSANKGVMFDNAGTRTYRAVVTFESGHVQHSNSTSLTWRHPCTQDTSVTESWAATVQAVPGRSEETETDDHRSTWYEYGWWDASDGLDEACGGLTDGEETYQVKHVSASRSEMDSEQYGDWVSLGVHISFDGELPRDLVDGQVLVIGGTQLAFADASTAMATDGEFYYSWYAARDYEPDWWSHFSSAGQVEVSIEPAG